MFKNQIKVGNEKITWKEADDIVRDALDNITLSGFTTAEDLDAAVKINARNCDTLIDAILNKLYSTYSDAILFERKKKRNAASCNNIINLIDKETIVLSLIKARANDVIAKDNTLGDDNVEMLSK